MQMGPTRSPTDLPFPTVQKTVELSEECKGTKDSRTVRVLAKLIFTFFLITNTVRICNKKISSITELLNKHRYSKTPSTGVTKCMVNVSQVVLFLVTIVSVICKNVSNENTLVQDPGEHLQSIVSACGPTAMTSSAEILI